MILGIFEMFGETMFSEKERVIFSMLTIIYVIHVQFFWHDPLAFLGLLRLGFCGMFDFPGFAMFDKVEMLFLFSII